MKPHFLQVCLSYRLKVRFPPIHAVNQLNCVAVLCLLYNNTLAQDVLNAVCNNGQK